MWENWIHYLCLVLNLLSYSKFYIGFFLIREEKWAPKNQMDQSWLHNLWTVQMPFNDTFIGLLSEMKTKQFDHRNTQMTFLYPIIICLFFLREFSTASLPLDKSSTHSLCTQPHQTAGVGQKKCHVAPVRWWIGWTIMFLLALYFDKMFDI